MTSHDTGTHASAPTMRHLTWSTGISALIAASVLMLGFWYLVAGGMAEWLTITGLTLIDGPLVQGPLISVSDIFRDIQIGQFQ